MTAPLRFAELFAGAGGLSMGLERAGLTCAWHAEINEQARAVLTARWPDVPLVGDVTELNGRDLVSWWGPIDLLSGGSPCQDLSVAGKRAGLSGARSSLFFHQMRLWDETGANLCLWENVDGARSSNGGADFAAVLRAFVGADITVPADGWKSGGVAAGRTGVAAWRVLDAQFFGVPQRRRRVFVLGARGGSVDPAEVLSLAESLCGDSSSGNEAREGFAADADGSAQTAIGWDAECNANGEVVGSLTGHHSSHNRPGVLSFDWRVGTGDPCGSIGATPALQAVTDRLAVLAFNQKQDGSDAATIAPSLLAMPHDESHANGGGQLAVIAFDTTQITHPENRSNPQPGDPCHPLASAGHAPTVIALNNDSRAAWSEQSAPLRAGERAAPSVFADIPRRLTPRECERLMGWPDDHTLVLYNGKPMSDAARYKMCGNGVASVVAHWIGCQLVNAGGSR